MKASNKKRSLVGLIFIALGLTIFISIFNVPIFGFRLPRLIFSWPIILILLGIILMDNKKNRSIGATLFLIGLVFLIKDFFHLNWVFLFKLIVPSAFVLLGIVMLFPRRLRSDHSVLDKIEYSSDLIDDVNIFGGNEKAINSEAFRGGRLSCFFGGSTLNFKRATLAPGENILDVICIFGGCTFLVPEDWTIVLKTFSVFGGFSDVRHKKNPHLITDPNKVLTIKGFVLFGGGDIKFA